jgi:hypothetical protein
VGAFVPQAHDHHLLNHRVQDIRNTLPALEPRLPAGHPDICLPMPAIVESSPDLVMENEKGNDWDEVSFPIMQYH